MSVKEDTQTYQQGDNTIQVYRRITVTPGNAPSPTPQPPSPTPTPGPTPAPTGDLNKEGVKILAKRTAFAWEIGSDPNNDTQLKLESLSPSSPKTEGAVKFHSAACKVIHYASGQPDSKTIRFDMFPPGAKGQAQKHTWKDNPQFLWDSSVPLDFAVIGFYRPHTGTGAHTSTSIKIRGGIHTGSHDPRSSDLEMDLPTVGGGARWARELNHPDYDYNKVDQQFDKTLGIEENVWYGLQLLSWINPDGKSTTNQLYVLRDPFNQDGSIKNENWKLFSHVVDKDGKASGRYTKAPLWSAFVTTLRVDGWDQVDFCKLAMYGIEKPSSPTPIPTPTPTPLPPGPTPQPTPAPSDVPLPTPIQITKTIDLPVGETDFPSEFTTLQKWGNSVAIKGAGMDKTILKFNGLQGSSDSALVSVNSDIRLENMTVDASRLVDHSLVCGENVKLELVNCHFKSGTQITTWTGGNMKTIVVQKCKFSDGSKGDQLAIGVNEAELVEDCIFDRSDPNDPGGSCLTHGFARNATIRNNTMIRSKEGFGISFEPWEKFGYNGIRCYNNKIINGDIIVGGPFTKLSFTFPYRNVVITQNDITNGYIHIDAPDLNSTYAKYWGITDIGLGYDQMVDVHFDGNVFHNPAGKQNIVISGEYRQSSPTPTPIPPGPTPVPPIPQPPGPTPSPTGKILQGAMTDISGNEQLSDSGIKSFNSLAKKKIAIAYTTHHWFKGVEPFPKSTCDIAKANNAVPFLRLNADELKSTVVTCAAINSGKYDTELQQYAKDAAAWGGRILMEIGTEVNGNFLAFSGEGKNAYIQMVQKVIPIFKSIAPNVKWVFHGDYNDLSSHPEQWYPSNGDQLFDWIGTSMYGQSNGKGCIGSLGSGSPTPYDVMSTTGNKPLAILEWGIADVTDTTNTLKNIPVRFPKIKLMSYWNEKGSFNRLIQKTPAHLKAYQDGISNDNYTSTYYNP